MVGCCLPLCQRMCRVQRCLSAAAVWQLCRTAPVDMLRAMPPHSDPLPPAPWTHPQDECAYYVTGQVSGPRGRRTRTFSKLCVTSRFGYLAFDKYDKDD